MSKYYFQKDDENCYTLQYHIDYMKENHIKYMEVFEAKVERGTGYFFCKHFQEFLESGESCGKACQAYNSRNKKNGICNHYAYVYEQTQNSKTLNYKISE